MVNNFMELKFKALSVNEAFARTCIAAFCLQLNPNVEELNDIKTAVSEAVTNCVVHAYPNSIGDVEMTASITDDLITISVRDNGIGISDFEQAKMPFFTTKPDTERSGMGFAVMESFMDSLKLEKNGLKGLSVTMTKSVGKIEREVVGG